MLLLELCQKYFILTLVMPLLQFKSNIPNISEKSSGEIHHLFGQILADELGKSIQYVMVSLEFEKSLSFSGDSTQPCAYIEVKNVGTLSPDTTSKISNRLTDLCSHYFKIEPSRVYIEFQESERHLWGWNGSTFA
jgi:phenylpyruvate tautomerase